VPARLIDLPDTLLERPADEAARLIALRLLSDAATARLRLGHAEDPEALHDFRVALRRLRSALRAWRPHLAGAVSKRSRRRLRALARATGRSRDLEVHLAWVRARATSLRDYQRPGADWLLSRMEARKVRADRRLEARLKNDFERTELRLRAGLAGVRVLVVPPLPVAYAATGAGVLGRLVADLGVDLANRLVAVRTIADQVEAHQARIAGKRLRYVLEPLATRIEGAPAIIAQLKVLQEGLGRLHDAHVFAGYLARALQSAAAEQARRVSHELLAWAAADAYARDAAPGEDDPRLGLVALAQRLREEAELAYAELKTTWLDGGSGPLIADVGGLAHRLASEPSVSMAAESARFVLEDGRLAEGGGPSLAQGSTTG
jgi:CHAD domain-containing protein